jgi:tRNA nucleotidyltransferase (CCA-adding enzyme)
MGPIDEHRSRAPMALRAGDVSGWNHFSHEADIGLHGYGATLAIAFEQTARALTGAMVDPDTVRPTETIALDCRAPDVELLLVDWLNALIFEMATRRMLFGRFSVRLEDGALHATAAGESVDVERHRPAVEVKGATYTGLTVARGADGLWHARCVIDV